MMLTDRRHYFNAIREETIMTPPRPIHKAPIHDFTLAMTSYWELIPLDDTLLGLKPACYSHIVLAKDNIIPDFQLCLVKYAEADEPEEIWAGEIGFSSMRSAMKEKLLCLAARPSLQLTFMISIIKKKYSGPNKDSTTAKSLCSIPMLTYKEFISDHKPSFEPIIMHGINWISLQSIKYDVCICTPEGTFNFDGTDSATTAHSASIIAS